MDVLYLTLSAMGGGIASALLGWAKSGEKFASLKFLPSFLRSLFAGATFAVGSTAMSGVATWENLVVAFLAGAGIDVGLHRLAGSKAKG